MPKDRRYGGRPIPIGTVVATFTDEPFLRAGALRDTESRVTRGDEGAAVSTSSGDGTASGSGSKPGFGEDFPTGAYETTAPVGNDFRGPDGGYGSNDSTALLGVPPTDFGTGTASQPVVTTDAADRRGTISLGVLVLRVVTAVIFIAHGLQKVTTGFANGMGPSGFEEVLVSAGFEQARLLTYLTIAAEIGGGLMLLLGLVTPLAAGALLVVAINAWMFLQSLQPGIQILGDGGVEFETLLVAALIALILTGPGRISLDFGRQWSRRPRYGSFVIMLVGVAAPIVIWVLLNGSNPLH